MVNTKEKFLKEINSAAPVNTQMVRKQSNIIVDTGKILVFWIDNQINHNIPLIASLLAQTVKYLPVMWETWVQSLGWEDPWSEGIDNPF